MLGSGRGADVARSELKYHVNLVVDLVTLRQSLALFEWDPGTLLFSIAPLKILMRPLLDLSL